MVRLMSLQDGRQVLAVGEGQVAELDAAADRAAARCTPGAVGDRRLDGEDGVHALQARRAALVEIDDVAERDERPDESRQVEVELGELPDRDLAAHGERPPYQMMSTKPSPMRNWISGRITAEMRTRLRLRSAYSRFRCVEGRDLRVLLRVGAHDADAREVLLRARRDLREEVLNLLEADVHLLAEVLDRQRDERHRHEEQQRQAHADPQHQRQDDDDDEDGLQRVHDHRPGELAHGGQVVGRARHQVAGAVLVEEGERLALEVRVEVAPQVVLDVARHADEDAPLEEEEDAADDARRRG